MITREQVKKIGDSLAVDWMEIDFDQLFAGAKDEAEHDTGDPQTDILPGRENHVEWVKIALAHLKEDPQHYNKLFKAMAPEQGLAENREYDQALYTSSWDLKIYKKVGGDLTQTLNEIRSIRNVTTVFRVDDGFEDASQVDTVYDIKFVLRRKQNPVEYIKKVLRPGLGEIEGMNVVKFKHYKKLK